MKKTIALSNVIATIVSALKHQSEVESEGLTFRESSKIPLNKKDAEAEAEELPYAAMLAGQTGIQQPKGPINSLARIQITLNPQPLGACCS